MHYKAPTAVSTNTGSHHLLGFEANHKMEKLSEFQIKRRIEMCRIFGLWMPPQRTHCSVDLCIFRKLEKKISHRILFYIDQQNVNTRQ